MQFFKRLVVWTLKITLVIGVILIGGFTIGDNTPSEIKPGEGFSQSSIQVNIDARSDKWTDSGASIAAATKELKFTVNGSVFLCAGTGKPYQSEVFNVYANKNDFIDTKFTLSSGDYLKFKLVPFGKEIKNCGTITSNNDFSFDEEGTFKNKSGSNLKATDLCRGGDLYKNGDLVMNKPSSENIMYLQFADNSNSWAVQGNKWLRSDNSGNPLAGTQWFVGAFQDLRLSEEGENNPISGFDCNTSTFNSNRYYKKFEALTVNKKCNKYARDGGSVFSYNQIVDGDKVKFEVAEGLVAKIKTDTDILCFDDADGLKLCDGTIDYSNADKIAERSIKLNKDYILPVVANNSKLLIGIEDENIRYNNNLGGYSVEIMHSCPKSDGENLYLYIGDSVPVGLKPGDPDTIEVKAVKGSYTFNNPGKEGHLFFMIKDNLDGQNGEANYGNNYGSYKVDFRVSKSPTWISEIMKYVTQPLKDVIYKSNRTTDAFGQTTVSDSGASYDFYHNIMDGGMRGIVRALLILYVVVISLGFLLGLVELKTDVIFMTLFKIGAVLILLSDKSWYILNKYLFDIFWYGADSLIGRFVEFYQDNGTDKYDASFKFLDKTLGSVFAWENLTKYLSLFFLGFTNPLSWALFVSLTYAFWDMICACFKGILLYCTCIIINGLLIGLAPIFMCFILFKMTFRFFDSWIKQLIGNMMTVVLYFITIGMLNEILYNLIYQIFNFGVYKECMLPISLGSWKVCLVQFPMPFAGSVASNLSSNGAQSAEGLANILPINIPLVIVYIIFTKCFHIIIDVIQVLPSSIFGGSMMYSAMDVTNMATEGAKYAVGQDKASIDRRKRAMKDLKGRKGEKKAREFPKSTISTTASTKPDGDGSGSGGGSGGSGGFVSGSSSGPTPSTSGGVKSNTQSNQENSVNSSDSNNDSSKAHDGSGDSSTLTSGSVKMDGIGGQAINPYANKAEDVYKKALDSNSNSFDDDDGSGPKKVSRSTNPSTSGSTKKG